ncbi:hypothetical protein TNCV_534081 [Trichonephila clavipes]|nr:hypothetical protein TNCV_534081 [Trichonephila clavipes]
MMNFVGFDLASADQVASVTATDFEDTELTSAHIFDCPANLAALQEIKDLFSSTNLYVNNIEQIGGTVILAHGTI